MNSIQLQEYFWYHLDFHIWYSVILFTDAFAVFHMRVSCIIRYASQLIDKRTTIQK